MGDTYYADNYEELTGRDRDGTLGPILKPLDPVQPVRSDEQTEAETAPADEATEEAPTVETKVVAAPEQPAPEPQTEAETA